MDILKTIETPAAFCSRESRRFWEARGKQWWHGSKNFSNQAYRAILEDAFGYEKPVTTTSCYKNINP